MDEESRRGIGLAQRLYGGEIKKQGWIRFERMDGKGSILLGLTEGSDTSFKARDTMREKPVLG